MRLLAWGYEGDRKMHVLYFLDFDFEEEEY